MAELLIATRGKRFHLSRDSKDLGELKAATKEIQKQTDTMLAAGLKLEESRAIEQPAATIRQNTIRTFY